MNAFREALAAADLELDVELARSAAQVTEAKRLRYRVYCEERGFERGENGLEQDEYDGYARHVLVRARASGEVIATARLVPGAGTPDGFPMERLCDPAVFAAVPRETTAEVSRFAVTRQRTGLGPEAASLVRLYLVRGVIAASAELGLTDWCAIMERRLIRLMAATCLHFVPVGQAVEYRGIRQPVLFNLQEGFARSRRENPLLWRFFAGEGVGVPEAALPVPHAVAA